MYFCRNLGDYSDLYLMTDVLLLSDIFEKFRSDCLDANLYGLDPAHYLSAPGIAWDAMLKITKAEVQIVNDLEMINFFRSGIRGGLSQVSLRKADAKNKYVCDSSTDIEDPCYIIYFDYNNLYGSVMCEMLPLDEFAWIPQTDLNNLQDNIMSIDLNAYTGYILEVEVDYPNDLHQRHNEFPYLIQTCDRDGKRKLCATLENKHNYVVHLANLQQAIAAGLELKKITRAVSFHQSRWMEPYITLNNNRRATSTSKTIQDTCKLLNNAVFGKTMENVLKRVNLKLIKFWENRGHKRGLSSYIVSGHMKRLIEFSEDFFAVELQKSEVVLDKPLQVGFSILDLAKIPMYRFHYDFMQPRYGKKATLAYMDTDSFIYLIYTEDLYKDLKEWQDTEADLFIKFDTSDYSPTNMYGIPLKNKKLLGALKDETKGEPIKSYCGVAAKTYMIELDSRQENKAKGSF